jgi:HEAT repeat protein
MPQPVAAKSKTKPDASALDQAFEALKTYGEGSGRAALLPIDEALVACLDDQPARRQMESRLMAALQAGGSVVAREYVCTKLALLGSERAVSAFGDLLSDPQLSTPARTALEAIPSPEASEALRKSLPKLSGLHKVGVIHSLGACRDKGSVRALTALMRDADPHVAGAAVAALGDIGSAKAAKVLRAFAPKAPEVLRLKLADAALVCAERLLAAGRSSEAQALAQVLDVPEQPKHVRQAAARLATAHSAKP